MTEFDIGTPEGSRRRLSARADISRVALIQQPWIEATVQGGGPRPGAGRPAAGVGDRGFVLREYLRGAGTVFHACLPRPEG